MAIARNAGCPNISLKPDHSATHPPRQPPHVLRLENNVLTRQKARRLAKNSGFASKAKIRLWLVCACAENDTRQKSFTKTRSFASPDQLTRLSCSACSALPAPATSTTADFRWVVAVFGQSWSMQCICFLPAASLLRHCCCSFDRGWGWQYRSQPAQQP